MTRAETYTNSDGVYKRYKKPDLNASGVPIVPTPTNPLASRANLVYGTYRPDADTTGHIVTPDWKVLGDTSTNTFTPVAGQLYENMTIYGDIKLPTAGPVLFRNCELVGGSSTPTSDTGIVTAQGAIRGGYADFYDCTIRAWNPKNGRNGFIGRQYRAYRCNVSNVTDPFGVYSTLGPNTDADVEIRGCWGHDALYSYPDPASSNHSDGAHTDIIQCQGGSNVWIQGNFLEGTGVPQPGTGANPLKPWIMSETYGTNWANGVCCIIQNGTGAGINGSTFVVEDNWTKGGISHYALHSNITTVTVRNGKVYRDVAIRPAGATGENSTGYWMRGSINLPKANVTGLYTHKWIDGPYAGQLLNDSSRDRGIIFDFT